MTIIQISSEFSYGPKALEAIRRIADGQALTVIDPLMCPILSEENVQGSNVPSNQNRCEVCKLWEQSISTKGTFV